MEEPRIAAPSGAVTTDSASGDRHWGPGHRRRNRSLTAIIATLALTTSGGAAAATRGVLASSDPAPAASAAQAATAAPSDPAPAAATPDPAPAPPAAPASGPAYRVAAGSGEVYEHGWFADDGSAAGQTKAPIVGLAQSADGDGYWLAAADGGVFAFGDAEFLGSGGRPELKQPIVGIAATPSRPRLLARGRRRRRVRLRRRRLLRLRRRPPDQPAASSRSPPHRPATATGSSASDGGVFAFGDAGFFGSLGRAELNAEVVDLVPTASGHGYYLVGCRRRRLHLRRRHLLRQRGRPAAGQAGRGHGADARGRRLLVAHPGRRRVLLRPGAVPRRARGRRRRRFVHRHRGRHRSPRPGRPGGRRGSGARRRSSGARSRGPVPVAAPAPAPAPAPSSPTSKARQALLDGVAGFDVSFPQCHGNLPESFDFVVVGVTGGREFRNNACLADQWQWASRGPAGFYVNVNFPHTPDELAAGDTSDRQPDCNGVISCVAYNFGVNGVRQALSYAKDSGVSAPFVWLDVEQLNHWTPDQALNAVVLRGALDAVQEVHLGAGIYSTPYQFQKIMGGEQPGVPVWTAGAPGLADVAAYCATKGFGGGPVAMVQLLPQSIDQNVACPGAGPISRYFTLPGR